MKRKNHDITTANKRSKLKPRKEPYWAALGDGVSLGYYRRKIGGGSWIVRRREKGAGYKFESIGDADDKGMNIGKSYVEALKSATDTEKPVAAGTHRLTVQDAIDAYLNSKETTDADSRLKDHPLASKKLDLLSANDLRGWMDSLVPKGLDKETRRKKRATANRNRTALVAALNFAVKYEMTSNTKFRLVEPFPKVKNTEFRFLTEREAEQLLMNCNSAQLRDLCEAALMTGARYGELCVLRVRDYDPDEATVRLSGSKTETPRTVGLTTGGKRLFDHKTRNAKPGDFIFTNTSGNQWGKNHQAHGVRQAYKKAKLDPDGDLPSFSFKSLRATYGSWLARAGVTLLNISKALGHKDTRITSDHYADLIEEDQHAIIRLSLPKLKRTA